MDKGRCALFRDKAQKGVDKAMANGCAFFQVQHRTAKADYAPFTCQYHRTKRKRILPVLYGQDALFCLVRKRGDAL